MASAEIVQKREIGGAKQLRQFNDFDLLLADPSESGGIILSWNQARKLLSNATEIKNGASVRLGKDCINRTVNALPLDSGVKLTNVADGDTVQLTGKEFGVLVAHIDMLGYGELTAKNIEERREELSEKRGSSSLR